MSQLHAFGFSIAAPASPAPAPSRANFPTGRPRALAMGFATYGSVYDAATRAGLDGYFYVPWLTPSKSLGPYPLRILREKSWWAYCNIPVVRMVIDGLAQDEVGTGLWPQWQTKSSEFNDRLTEDWHYQNHDARFFSPRPR